jgi:hypothetical protein
MTLSASQSADLLSARRPWALLAPPIAAMLYPLPLAGFHAVVSVAKADPSANWAAASLLAALLLAAAFAVPAFALFWAMRLSEIVEPSVAELRARRVAFLAVAAPAHFTFIGTSAYMLGVSWADAWVLGLYWAGWAVYVATGSAGAPAAPARPAPARLLSAHGVVALIVILGFLGLHLANHLAGLSGPDAHTLVMKLLRRFYRAPAVEPLLMAGVFALMVSGGFLAVKATRVCGDRFRTLQIATGVFLFFFLLSHSSAVFVLARSFLHIDANWDFGAGLPTGLIFDAWNIRLVPYYAIGVFCAVAHPFCGARAVLLAHGARRERADAIAVAGGAGGVFLAIVLTLALCGLRLHFQ